MPCSAPGCLRERYFVRIQIQRLYVRAHYAVAACCCLRVEILRGETEKRIIVFTLNVLSVRTRQGFLGETQPLPSHRISRHVQQLLHRTAHANGDFAWVASESELHIQQDGKPVTVLSTETMVLRREASNWRIVHIHWSSRTKKPSAAH